MMSFLEIFVRVGSDLLYATCSTRRPTIFEDPAASSPIHSYNARACYGLIPNPCAARLLL